MATTATDPRLITAWVAETRATLAVLCMKLAQAELSPAEWAGQVGGELAELEHAVSLHALHDWPHADEPALHLAGQLAVWQGRLPRVAVRVASLPDASLTVMPRILVPDLLSA